MIFEVFSSGPVETNTFLLGCPLAKKGVIIDAPFESSGWQMQRVRELGLNIEKILLTHSHWDHIAEAHLLQGLLGAPVYINEEDLANLEHPGADGLPLAFPVEGVKPAGFLTDGQTIKVGALEIKVIHTPGHSAGSVCFYLEAEKLLISGDTLFRGTIGHINFPSSRPDLMWDSLKRLAALPADTKVFPGHGESTTIGRESSWLTRAKERFLS
jgi:hydroxyacylglutathione hydrolase